ncbi:hypothetical protein [Ferroplasma sp.]|uniref:hypothetical protein n=1 Tax=Ferroplasma sp. TaxID=2591003 RepID=UPI00307D7953
MINFLISEKENIDIKSEIRYYNPTKLLISDGIMLERNILDCNIKIQRVMTPYQLNRILIEGNIERYLILISSFIFDAWGLMVVEELNYVMDQAAYNGSAIVLDIIGTKTVNAEFMRL